jgi:hypothetical protein
VEGKPSKADIAKSTRRMAALNFYSIVCSANVKEAIDALKGLLLFQNTWRSLLCKPGQTGGSQGIDSSVHWG